MVERSIREKLILADVALLKDVCKFDTVIRTLQSYADLQEFAQTQFPAAALVGGLPIPKNHIGTRNGHVDYIVSDLKVDIHVYMLASENQDSEISKMLNYMWPVLYSDPTRGELCITTQLTATGDIEFWAPYVAFRLTCIHQYQHTPGGI